MNKTTFFKEVASHNLERFHSECIAWVLNRIQEYDKENKIFKKFNAGEDFRFLKAVTEVQDHDIVLLYTNDKKFKYVFIENKTKSTLSRKHWVHKDDHKQVGTKVIDPSGNSARVFISEGMLQTAYYQLRWLVNKNHSSYKYNLFTEESFKYFFLSPESRQNLKEFKSNTSISEKFKDYWSRLGKNNKERSSVFSDRFTDPEWVILSQMKQNTFEKLYEGEESLNNTLNDLGIELKVDNKINAWDYLEYKDLFDVPLGLETEDENFDTIICEAYIDYVVKEDKESKELTELKNLLKLKKLLKKEDIVSTIGVGSANSGEFSIDITYNTYIKHKDINFKIAKKFENSFKKMLGEQKNAIFYLAEDKLNEAYNLYISDNKIVCALYKQGSLRFGFKHPNYHNAGYCETFTNIDYINFINTQILGCQKEVPNPELYDKLISFIGLNKDKYIIKRSTPPRTLSSYSFTIEKKDDSLITAAEHVEIAVVIKDNLLKK